MRSDQDCFIHSIIHCYLSNKYYFHWFYSSIYFESYVRDIQQRSLIQFKKNKLLNRELFICFISSFLNTWYIKLFRSDVNTSILYFHNCHCTKPKKKENKISSPSSIHSLVRIVRFGIIDFFSVFCIAFLLFPLLDCHLMLSSSICFQCSLHCRLFYLLLTQYLILF